MTTEHHLDTGSSTCGPCAKQVVVATVIAPSGESWTSSNYVRNPQSRCPRGDMPTGVGYEKCRDICDQVGHAEVNVLRFAGHGALGGTLVMRGHTCACETCKNAAREAGIIRLVIEGVEQPL